MSEKGKQNSEDIMQEQSNIDVFADEDEAIDDSEFEEEVVETPPVVENKQPQRRVRQRQNVEANVQEQPVKEKPVKEKSVKEKSVKEKPVKEKHVKEKPVKEKPLKEKPVKAEKVENPDSIISKIKALPSKVKIIAVVVIFILILIIAKVASGAGGKKNDTSDFFTHLDKIFSNELGTFNYSVELRSAKAGNNFAELSEDVESGTSSDGNVTSDTDSADNKTSDANSATSSANSKTSSANSKTSSANSKTSSATPVINTTTPNTVDDFTSQPINVSDTWSNDYDIKEFGWKYPNFKISFTGNTMSLDPLTTTVDVKITTPYHDSSTSQFTTLRVVEDDYYLNIEDMRNWLNNSKDYTFRQMCADLPTDVRWLHMTKDEFVIPSPFAEDGEEEVSARKGLRQLYLRDCVAGSMIFGQLKKTLSDSAFGKEKDTGANTLDISDSDGVAFVNGIRNLVNRSGDFYTSVVNTQKSNHLFATSKAKSTDENADVTTDSQGVDTNEDKAVKQALREKDNIVNALVALMEKLSVTDANTVNFTAKGKSNAYDQTIDCDCQASFVLDDVQYELIISAKKTGSKKDITKPDEKGFIEIKDYKEGYNWYDIAYEVLDYLDPFGIKFVNKLEKTPESVTNDLLDSFMAMVNQKGTCDYVLNKYNLTQFLSEYMLYIEDKNSTDNEKANAKMTKDFLDSLSALSFLDKFNKVMNEIKDVVGKEEPEQPSNEPTTPDVPTTPVEEVDYKAQVSPIAGTDYNNITSTNIGGNKAQFVFSVNQSETTSDMVVVDMAVTLTEITPAEFNKIKLTDFNIQTLLGSKYPANNEVLIRNYDNGFDFKKLQTELAPINFDENGTALVKLYFVTSNEATGTYRDLWYGQNKIEVLVQGSN